MKKMSLDVERTGLDISEKGRAKDGTELSSDRRLLMQLLAFGNCHNTRKLVDELKKSKIDFALYADINDPYGIGLLAVNEDPDFFVGQLREFLNGSSFSELTPKPEYTMLGRTYSFG
ncbi:MAG TPA: hypothetical protein VFJ67_08710, partial [Thermodesulfobacteriota bacterium]|nr:hypothetical protein [Thermodesulfobacteriota bacterium]